MPDFSTFNGFTVKDPTARQQAAAAAAAAAEAKTAAQNTVASVAEAVEVAYGAETVAYGAESLGQEALDLANEVASYAVSRHGTEMEGNLSMGGFAIDGLPGEDVTPGDDEAISFAQAKLHFARSGNGLGEIGLSSVMDLDDLFTNGWYEYWGDSIMNDDPTFEKGLVFVQGWDGDGSMRTAIQTFYPYYVGVGHLVRQYGFIMEDEEEWWGPWEWVNPQMALNTEYRLTERWLGKPVYTKVIYLGYLSGTNKSVEAGVNYDKVIDLKVVAYGNGQYCTVLPMFGGGTLAAAAYMMGTKISLSIPQDGSGNQAYAVIKYTR